jgi:hypothetical protein
VSGGAGGRSTARRCCHLGTRERGGRGRGSTGVLSGKPTGTGPASRCRKNASVSIRRTSRSPRPPERCGSTSSGINFFITVSTLMAAGQVSRSLERPAWPRGYAHGCGSKRPSRLSQSEFPRELARQFPGVFFCVMFEYGAEGYPPEPPCAPGLRISRLRDGAPSDQLFRPPWPLAPRPRRPA